MRRDTRSPGGEHPTLLEIGDTQAALPRDLVPMRPRLAADAFNSPDHLFELKWDGIEKSRDEGRAGRQDIGVDATRGTLAVPYGSRAA